jgi:predicted porin
MFLKILKSMLLISFLSVAHAQSGNPTRSGFKVFANLKAQHGTFGSKDGSTVKGRALNGAGVDATLAFHVGPFLAGAGGEYLKFNQQSKVSDNTNLSGSMTNLFGVAGIGAGKFLLLGKYVLSSSYAVDKKSAADDKVTYSSPESSYGASLSYKLGHRSMISFDYSQLGFSKEKRGSTTKKFDSNSVMKLSTYGISYGLNF